MLRTDTPQLSTHLARGFRLWSALIGSLVSLGGACILDDERCDENQTHSTEGVLDYCKCAPGSVPDPKGYGCIRCRANEMVEDGKCVCKEGFTKGSPTAACKESVGPALGSACEDHTMCSEPYPYCATDASEKYCTKQGCMDTDCPADFTCEMRGGERFCAKLPSGIGEPCMANADCASYDADECDTFNKKCVLGGCAMGKRSCPHTWVCCDLSMFVPGVSVCGGPDAGMCPGKVVTP